MKIQKALFILILLSCATKEKFIEEDNFTIANNEFRNKNYADAIENFKKYINKDLNDLKKTEYANYQIATAYNNIGDYKNAIKEYIKFIKSYPSSSFSKKKITE